MQEDSIDRLNRSFFNRSTLDVARSLLGCRLVRVLDDKLLAAVLVEVEAYIGPTDRASHAFRGRTSRNSVMFGPPGFLYVYFTYGMHFCMNIVTEAEGYPAAVLLRAAHPTDGIPAMESLRHSRPLHELTSGPAKLCQAFAVDRAFNGEDLIVSQRLWVEGGAPIADGRVATGPRIGVERTGEAASYPWRFWVKDDPFVSHRRARSG